MDFGTPRLIERSVPRHVAIIMDGNGRWASGRGEPRSSGHAAGAKRVREIVRTALETEVRHLTLYAFSTENWKRPVEEIDFIFATMIEFLSSQTTALEQQGVRLSTIGDLARLPLHLQARLSGSVKETERGEKMELVLAVNYGARAELTTAVREIAASVAKGDTSLSAIDEHLVAANLEGSRERPDVDLLIRTGGEMRLSNFLLWQAAYAELYFTDCPWPEFDAHEFRRVLKWYSCRERRFGGASRSNRLFREPSARTRARRSAGR